MAEFRPDELDLIEDLLEGLEEVEDLNSVSEDPRVRERLSEYRDLLRLSRDCLPLEEPDDSVTRSLYALAEMEAEGERNETRDAGARRGWTSRARWRHWWDQSRALLGPAAAAAVAAGAVTWWLVAPQPAALVASTDQTTSDSFQPAAALETEAKIDTVPKPAPQIPPAEVTEVTKSVPPVEPSLATEKAKPRVAAKSKRAKKADAQAGRSSVPKMDKDDQWDALARADKARRRGDCGGARRIYQKLLGAPSSSRVRGRAHAGIGLCQAKSSSGNTAAHYRRAEKVDPGVRSWIAQEEREMERVRGK